MPTTVVTDTHQLPTQWWNYLSKSNELLLQRNGQPVAVLLSFDYFMRLKAQLGSRNVSVNEHQLNEQSQSDEQMRAAALALLDDYTNDSELTIFTTALGGEEFYDYDE